MSRKARSTSVFSEWSWITIAFLLIGIGVGFFDHWKNKPEGVEAGVVVLLVLFFLERLIHLAREFREFSLQSDPMGDVHKYLKERSGIFRELLHETHKEVSSILKVEDDSISICSPEFALLSYANFWKFLVQEQSSRVKRGKNPLTVQATHGCDPGVWDKHPLSGRLAELQAQFVLDGGKITRIFCVRGDLTEKWHDARGKMSPEIIARYYRIDPRRMNFNFGWDFLIVKELSQYVVWDTNRFEPDEMIEKASFLTLGRYSDKEIDIDKLWDEIYGYSAPFPAPAAIKS